jgi:hypothetical protein
VAMSDASVDTRTLIEDYGCATFAQSPFHLKRTDEYRDCYRKQYYNVD